MLTVSVWLCKIFSNSKYVSILLMDYIQKSLQPPKISSQSKDLGKYWAHRSNDLLHKVLNFQSIPDTETYNMVQLSLTYKVKYISPPTIWIYYFINHSQKHNTLDGVNPYLGLSRDPSS